MATDNICFYLQNRLIQTSKTGGQWYSDTSPFSILEIEAKKASILPVALGIMTLSIKGLHVTLSINDTPHRNALSLC